MQKFCYYASSTEHTNRRQMCKNVYAMCIPTELPFCMPPLVVGEQLLNTWKAHKLVVRTSLLFCANQQSFLKNFIEWKNHLKTLRNGRRVFYTSPSPLPLTEKKKLPSARIAYTDREKSVFNFKLWLIIQSNLNVAFCNNVWKNSAE